MWCVLSIQNLVPCILVTFQKEQIVIWRGKDYQPSVAGYFFNIKETFDDSEDDSSNPADQDERTDESQGQSDFESADSDD